MRVTQLGFVVLLLSSFTSAYKIEKTVKYGGPGRMLVFSSFYTFTYDLGYIWGYNLETKKMGSFYDGACAYEPAVGTVLLTAANKFGPYSRKFNNTVYFILEKCIEGANFTGNAQDMFNSYENATEYAFNWDRETNYTGYVFYEPVNMTKADIESRWIFYVNDYYNFDSISMYAGIFYLFFVLVFLIHGFANLLIRFGVHTKFNGKWIKWYRAKISIPALFKENHTQQTATFKIFTTLLPTRIESIVIFLFICLNVLLLCVHYDFSSKFVSKQIQFVEFVANRTGLLSFGLVPLLVIFAGRNNILISLTGITYSTFIQYHKWVARFMTIHAIIHSAMWTAYGVINGYLTYYYSLDYWRWGAVATVACSLILFQAFHMFRKLSYEWFLVIHIVFAAVFIVGCFYHCVEIGFLEWIWVSIALWILDRVTRVVRILMFGIRKAEIKYISDDTFRVTARHNSLFHPFPGSYAFIHFITPLQFWQAHPFTILSSIHEENTIIIYIKAKQGLTNVLKKKLEKSSDLTTEMFICVEGPYGHRSPVEKYDSVLLLAGGNGIPGLFAHASDLAKRGLSYKKSVRLIWSIRNPESLIWFADELRTLIGTNVKVDIFITKTKDENESIVTQSKKLSSEQSGDCNSQITADVIIKELYPYINFHYQRPDVEELIKEEMLAENGPSVAVVSCGPPKMVDLTRKSVACYLQEAKGRVDLFEELQVW